MSKRFSDYNPFLRKNLIRQVSNTKLIDIVFVFLSHRYNQVFLSKKIEDILDYVVEAIFVFSNGTTLKIKGLPPFKVEIRDFQINYEHIVNPVDYIIEEVSYFKQFKFPPREILFSLKNARYADKKILNQSFHVKKYYLLKEAEFFLKMYANWGNDFRTRGIRLEAENGQIINIYIGCNQEAKILNIDFNEDVITSCTLRKSNTFYSLEKGNKGYVTGKYYHFSNVKILTTEGRDIRDSGIDKIIRNVNNFHRYIRQNKEKNKDKHLTFFVGLKREMKLHDFGIPDLKFAILKTGELKIVTPIDIGHRIPENDSFINSLIHCYIKPEKIFTR